MADSNKIYYLFKGELTTEQLEDVLGWFDANCEVERPADGDVTSYVDELESDLGYLRLSYAGTGFSLFLDHGEEEPAVDLPGISIGLQDHVLFPQQFEDGSEESDRESVERLNAFYTFLGDCYEQFVTIDREPVYVYGLNGAEYETVGDPDHARYVSREQIRAGEMPGVYWFQIVPPAITERVGTDRLLSAPAYRVEQLADGAVLLATDRGVTIDEPFEHSTEAVSEHLGLPWEP